MDSGTERVQSEFNSAISYLNRLNNYFAIAGNSAICLDIITWGHTLAVITRELSTKMKQDELPKFSKRAIDIIDEVDQIQAAINRRGASRVPRDLYKKLSEFEIDLRRVFKEAGLETKDKEYAGSALARTT